MLGRVVDWLTVTEPATLWARERGTIVAFAFLLVASILLVQLPAAHLLSARYGLSGVWMAYPVVFCVMLALQTAFYRRVWRHRKIERLA